MQERLNFTVFSILQHQNSLARAIVKAPHKFLNLCIGSEVMNELITSYSVLHTIFSNHLTLVPHI